MFFFLNMPPKKIIVKKIPLEEHERMVDYPKNFPRVGRLYLELLENKAKIKQDLINKEYVPRVVNKENEKSKEKSKESKKEKSKESKKEKSKESSSSISISSTTSPEIHENIEKVKESVEIDEKHSDSSSTSSESSSDEEEKQDEDDVSNRLHELLKSDKEKSIVKSVIKSNGSKYTHYEAFKQAPTLAELENKGQFQKVNELRDISIVNKNEHEEEDKKRELLFKFKLLRQSYPHAKETIPESYTVLSDYREMQKTYDDTVKSLSLDSSVSDYKKYLTYAFIAIEYGCGYFLGFDMSGYAQQQVLMMNSYEKLLIELGEKSYLPTGSRYPVELRLLGIIIINTGVFIIGKLMMKVTGANVLNLINGLTQNQNPQPNPKPSRRMKGPTINLDDIPDNVEQK